MDVTPDAIVSKVFGGSAAQNPQDKGGRYGGEKIYTPWKYSNPLKLSFRRTGG